MKFYNCSHLEKIVCAYRYSVCIFKLYVYEKQEVKMVTNCYDILIAEYHLILFIVVTRVFGRMLDIALARKEVMTPTLFSNHYWTSVNCPRIYLTYIQLKDGRN